MNTPLKEHVYMIHSNVKHIDVTNVNMKVNFRRHKVSVHQYSFMFEIKKSVFSCDTCGYEPTMNTPLKEHIYMIHSNVKHIDVTNVNMKVNFRRHKVSVHQYSFRFEIKKMFLPVIHVDMN